MSTKFQTTIFQIPMQQVLDAINTQEGTSYEHKDIESIIDDNSSKVVKVTIKINLVIGENVKLDYVFTYQAVITALVNQYKTGVSPNDVESMYMEADIGFFYVRLNRV